MSASSDRAISSGIPVGGNQKQLCKLSDAGRSWVYYDARRHSRSHVLVRRSAAALLWRQRNTRLGAHVNTHLGIFIECACGNKTRGNA
eukprot:3548246-Pleurochrysis_carterae.AAC.1